MSLLDDFLSTAIGQRLAQHLQSQVAPFEQVIANRNAPLADRALTGLQAGLQVGPKGLLDAVGLGLEGTQNITKSGLGALLGVADQHGIPLPGLSAKDRVLLHLATQTANQNMNGTRDPSQGILDAGSVVDVLRQNGDTPLAWGLGAAQMALDPSNFVLPEVKAGDIGKSIVQKLLPNGGDLAGKAAANVATQAAADQAAQVARVLGVLPKQKIALGVGDLPRSVAAPAAADIPVVEQVVNAIQGKAKQQASKFTPEQLTAIAADPRVQELQQTIADIKASVDPNATQISGQTGGTVKKLGSRLRGPQLRLNQLQKEIATGVTPVAPPVVSGPLKTIFGEDASVVHSGTYPGTPKAALPNVAPEVTPAAVNVVPPATAQEAAALAPDATINDKMNALEQNPNLPVPQGSAPSINTFSKLFEAAYGSAKPPQRRNAIPAMAKMLGATYRTDGTFWRDGVNVSQPAYDFLAQRATLGNDRKAIAAARDVAKQAADQLANPSPAAQVATSAAATTPPGLPPDFVDPGPLFQAHGKVLSDVHTTEMLLRDPAKQDPAKQAILKATLERQQGALAAIEQRIKDAGLTSIWGSAPGIAAGLNVPASVYFRGAGALAGGAAGAATSNNDPTAILGGALAGATGTAGLEKVATNATLRDLATIGHTAGKEGFADALKNGNFSLKSIPHDWSADKVKTVRGLVLDTLSNYSRALVNKVPLRDINAARTDLIGQVKAGTKEPLYTTDTAQLFDQLGQDIKQFDMKHMLGQGYLGSADKVTGRTPLHPAASAAAGAGYSLASPTTYLTSGIGTALAAARGAARPYTNAAFNAVNDLEHTAARDTAFRQAIREHLGEVAPEFLRQVAAAGGDVSKLAADGTFSPKQAEAALPGSGQVWQGVLDQILGTPTRKAVKENAAKGIAGQEGVDQATGLAGDVVKKIFGDYSNRGKLDKALGRLAPFSRYTLGQVPVTAALVAQHPGATLFAAKLLHNAYDQAAQTGTPSYNATNIDVPQGTPGLQGLANLEGGAPSHGGINFLNALSPVNVDVGGASDITDSSKTPYERAAALLNVVGLQPNPLIQAGAYVLGGTDQTPGNQSRFSGLENYLGQQAGGPSLPTIRGLLDNARQALGNYPSNYDPYQIAAAEIVLNQTGKPISDQSNKQYALQALDPNSPLMQQAHAQVDQGNAVKNLVSGLSPITLTSTTDTKQQYRQAKANDPRYTKEQIAQAAQVNLAIAAQMEAANAALVQQNPALVTYTQPKLSSKDKRDPRLIAFEQQYIGLKAVNPKLYQQYYDQYARQIGAKNK